MATLSVPVCMLPLSKWHAVNINNRTRSDNHHRRSMHRDGRWPVITLGTNKDVIFNTPPYPPPTQSFLHLKMGGIEPA